MGAPQAREGIQYVEHAEGHGDKLFAAVCNLGLEGIVSKRLTSVYKSGPSKTWIKVALLYMVDQKSLMPAQSTSLSQIE